MHVTHHDRPLREVETQIIGDVLRAASYPIILTRDRIEKIRDAVQIMVPTHKS